MSVKFHIPSAKPHKATMQYFSSSDCKHCNTFDKIFAGLATGSLPGQGVEFVCIDVTPRLDNGAAAKKHGVSKFPTIRLVTPSNTMSYPDNMSRDHENLSLWLLQALKQLQNSGTYRTWDYTAATARAGDPHMDQQASLRGDDRVNTHVPARYVYGRNNTNVKYRKYEDTPFQSHRNRERRDASKFNLSFAAADHNDDAAIRDSYPSTYQTGQDAGVGAETAMYATINMGEIGNVGY